MRFVASNRVWLLKSRALAELYSPPPANEVHEIHVKFNVLCVHTYIHTARCMPFVLVSLAPFEDVDTFRRVRYRVPLQFCYEKDTMLVTQQTESTYIQTTKWYSTCVQIKNGVYTSSCSQYSHLLHVSLTWRTAP